MNKIQVKFFRQFESFLLIEKSFFTVYGIRTREMLDFKTNVLDRFTKTVYNYFCKLSL